MPAIKILFRGICTHLVTTHQVPDAPRFELSHDGQFVQHRIFVPNSDFIATHIIGRDLVPHVPQLTITSGPPVPELEPLLAQPLKDVRIYFKNLDPQGGDFSHDQSLHDLPHIWTLAENERVYLRRATTDGWNSHASVYFDFTEGVSFQVLQVDRTNFNVWATLQFIGPPLMILHPSKAADGIPVNLRDGAELEFTNLPLPGTKDGTADYLLHYFATTMDLIEDAPKWPTWLPSDVYCSNSQYP